MKWAIVSDKGIVENVINYDPDHRDYKTETIYKAEKVYEDQTTIEVDSNGQEVESVRQVEVGTRQVEAGSRQVELPKYQPPQGKKLKQVNDWLNIGDHIDDEHQPHPGLLTIQ